MSTERCKTRIESVEDLKKVRARIGEQNFEGVQRALADGASVWVFLAKEEIEQDPDLSPQEKSECSVIFEREGYAGWLRPVKSQYIPGITIHPAYDTHGNYRGGGGGSSEGSRH